ncbi:MAG: hypothetical protein SFU98_11555 [Leptospiraceae bacterium]|nr:hypothetical protein [Leptospiraceae bacterium]
MASVSFIPGRSVDIAGFGPDPIMLRKRGNARNVKSRYSLYKQKINDPNYMEYAINKIAMELTHFLSK